MDHNRRKEARDKARAKLSTKTLAKADLDAMIVSLLDETKPVSLSAGEVARILARHFANVPSRSTVKRRLDDLAACGSIVASKKTVEANGYLVNATVYEAKERS